MNVKGFVPCTMHPNCFAYQNGGCSILKNTNFRKGCPFFKTQAQFDEDRARYGGEKPDPEEQEEEIA